MFKKIFGTALMVPGGKKSERDELLTRTEPVADALPDRYTVTDVACPEQHVIWSRHLVALERTEELTLLCIQNREREPCFAMLG